MPFVWNDSPEKSLALDPGSLGCHSTMQHHKIYVYHKVIVCLCFLMKPFINHGIVGLGREVIYSSPQIHTPNFSSHLTSFPSHCSSFALQERAR